MAKLLRFYQDRRPRWQRLDDILTQLDAEIPLAGPQADELYRLYRLVSCDLAFMQTHTGNPALLEQLEDLVARAHSRLTPPDNPAIGSTVVRVLRRDFPAVVRENLGLLALTLAIFLAGAAFGGLLFLAEPASAETFLAPFSNLLDQTPTEDARERMGTGPGIDRSLAFSIQLFSNNLRVAFLCFALGLTFGAGTAIVLFLNGAILGCVAVMYARDGVFLFFLSWVGPHGSLELPAIILAGMTGFMLARAELAGGRGVWRRIAARKRDYTAMLSGIALMLLVAGLIEGGFSQTHSETILHLKVGVAAALFLALLAWLFVPPAAGPDAPVSPGTARP